MRYLVACLVAAIFLATIYVIDWGARQALAQRIRSLGGDPAEPASDYQIELPPQMQTLLALDRLLFMNRFILTALALILFLAIAFYTRHLANPPPQGD